MNNQVSPWVRKIPTIYAALVVVGTVLGVLSGGVGGIWVLPLILPWAALQGILDEGMGGALLDSWWWGPASSLVFGALNAGILYWILRRIDRSRQQHPGRCAGARWITIVLVTYVVLLTSSIAVLELAGVSGPGMAAGAILASLTFPWIFVLWWEKPGEPNFWIANSPELVGGAINFCLLFVGLKLLDRRAKRKQSPAPTVTGDSESTTPL